MFRLSTQARATLGLVLVLLTSLTVARTLGLVPNERRELIESRVIWSQSLAVVCSYDMQADRLGELKAKLRYALERNPHVKSCGIRSRQGGQSLIVGPHREAWDESLPDSPDRQLRIPLMRGSKKWGDLEVCFHSPTAMGRPTAAWGAGFRLFTSICLLTLMGYYIYLGRTLRYLDPANAVPAHVRAALDTLAGGLLVVDCSGQIVLANRSFGNSVGRSPHELETTNVDQLPWIWDTQRSATSPWKRCATTKKASERSLLELACGDGDPKVFLVSASPVIGEDGQHRGALVGFEDVTTLEKTRAEVTHAKEEAEAANQAKSVFLARMSHEIRTPMNAILGFADALRRGLDATPAERAEYLEIIHNSGKHLLHLLNDILDISKVEAGKLELAPVVFAPAHLLEEVTSVLRHTAVGKGLRLTSTVSQRVPAWVKQDELRLRQILTNLVGNAIKFTQRGEVNVRLDCDFRDEHAWLFVVVQDSGIGIDSAQLAAIFEPFTQADSSMTRRFGGSGLGLAISRSFAQAMGGDIEASSSLDQGTTFTVRIDLGEIRELTHLGPPTPGELESADIVGSLSREGTPWRILVVDDGDSNRKLVSLLLRHAGAEVDQAANGREAIEQTRLVRYDAIVMDMQMPELDGYRAARMLREQGWQMPIVALTANVMEGEREKCIEAGCSEFLPKPLDADHLLITLRQVLPAEGQVGNRRLKIHDAKQTPRRPEASLDLESRLSLKRIHSTLPANDEEYCEIIHEFLDYLRARLDHLAPAAERGEDRFLADFAHWLKGAGGMAGFSMLSHCGANLELAVKQQDRAAIERHVAELIDMDKRLVDPWLDIVKA